MSDPKVESEAGPSALAKTSRKEDRRALTKMRNLGSRTVYTEGNPSRMPLRPEDLSEREKLALETIAIEEVFEILQSDDNGLSDEEGNRRHKLFGPNLLEREQQKPIRHILSFFWNPLSWVLEVAAILAIAHPQTGDHRPPDWPIFVGILALLILKSLTSTYSERGCATLVKSLMASYARLTGIKRNGRWREVEAAFLVPGDMICFKAGDVVHADCRLTEATNVYMNQSAVTGEPLPLSKTVGEVCFWGSFCTEGEARGVVIATGPDTFFYRTAALVGFRQDNDTASHLQKIIAQIGTFVLAVTGVFVLAEVIGLYAGFHYSYRRGLDNILVLLIGAFPVFMPSVLSTSLVSGVRELAMYKACVTRITAVLELAAVDVLCCGKTGSLTTNRLAIDHEAVCTYAHFSAEDLVLLSARASFINGGDSAIDYYYNDTRDIPARALAGIKVLGMKPFHLDPSQKRTEVTYLEESSGKVRRVAKGLPDVIMDLCTRNRTEYLESRLKADVEELARKDRYSIAVAYEEVDGADPDQRGNEFELVGLVPFSDPLREDTKQAVADARALGVRIKIVTGGHSALAKEYARRIGLGDNIYPACVLDAKDSHSRAYLEEIFLDADGFAGVLPAHKLDIVTRLQASGHLCAITGVRVGDTPALSRAAVGLAMECPCDAAACSAGVIMMEPGLSKMIRAISITRATLQRMRSYAIYLCAATVRHAVCFSLLAFVFKLDFSPFMILIMAWLDAVFVSSRFDNDPVLPSDKPDSWNLAEIIAYALAYGLYLALSTIALVAIAVHTTWFYDTFGVTFHNGATQALDPNDPQLHTIVFLQVIILTQALVFVTRSHGFAFKERPSCSRFLCFCVAQLVSSIIAAYGNWGFANIEAVSGSWVGIVWIWDIIWFLPLDLIKLAMKTTVIRYLRARHNAAVAARLAPRGTIPPVLSPTTYESLYGNCVEHLRSKQRLLTARHRSHRLPIVVADRLPLVLTLERT
ncbi:plasma membrane H+-transporting ATPase [Trametes polyzona]|nr:plasma membrane H+-transporting ATPase [Trametes polyzona]